MKHSSRMRTTRGRGSVQLPWMQTAPCRQYSPHLDADPLPLLDADPPGHGTCDVCQEANPPLDARHVTCDACWEGTPQ